MREQYIGGGLLNRAYVIGNSQNPTNQTVDNNHVSDNWTTDLHFTWSPPWKSKVEFYFNIDNLLDQAPPIVASFSQMGGTGPTNLGLYDQIGRRFVTGVHLTF